jgi:hypothetical protein
MMKEWNRPPEAVHMKQQNSPAGHGKASQQGALPVGFLHQAFRKAKGTKLLEASSVGDCEAIRRELAKGKGLDSRNDVRTDGRGAPRP